MPVTNTTSRILSLAVVALAGCATGHDGDVNIGSGQSPDPVVLDVPVAYVRSPLPVDLTELDDIDVREIETFTAGADVWLRDRAAPDVPEVNITERVTGGLWDVRDIDGSYDGTRIVFSMRMPLIPGAMDSEQPTWNVWEYDRTTDVLRRVIASDIVAEEGHDIAPHYLPDGRIVFSSTRQRQSKAVLIDEGKPQFAAQDEDQNEHAFVLHVMNADGSGIRQISFNQSHDLDPDVLDDGRIVFSRWENASGSSIHLYTVNPDGSGLELLYGANSHATGTGGAPTAPSVQGTAEDPVPAAAPHGRRWRGRAHQAVPGHRAGRRRHHHRHGGLRRDRPGRPRQPGARGSRAGRASRSATCAPIPASRRAGATRPCSRCATARAACCRPGPCAA